MFDELVTCPSCGSDACYSKPINETKNSYTCFGCGFNSNDLMVEGEYDAEVFEEDLPLLYRDIKKVDSKGRVWYPNVINVVEKGTVFANGKSAESWGWTAIKSRPLTEEEKDQLANKGIEFKSDSTTLRNFGNDFIEALDYIGYFNF